MSRLMSIHLVISGSVHWPSTAMWYISGDAQSCTVIVSFTEVVSFAGGVILSGVKLKSIPGGDEPAARDTRTKALKLLMEVI